MLYTVSDFLNTYGHGLRLVAGSGGLARTVSEVGILDYELVPGVKASYLRNNFYEGQLVLSTFLYARDAPYLMVDAVKSLVSAGASGLAVKNIFHLEIPEAALRFANARNFPLMIFSADDMYFDNVILEVGMRVRELADASFAQHELDALLVAKDDAAEVRTHAQRLNPSLGEELATIYAPFEDGLTPATFATLDERYRASSLAGVRNILCAFDQGVLLVLSGDVVTQADVDAASEVLDRDVLQGEAQAIGVGEPHQGIERLGDAVLQALHAARLSVPRGERLVRYADLGILRAVLPHAHERSMRDFARALMAPLRDFDAENNAQVSSTLEAYLVHGRSITQTAQTLGTHPNTVRYRLGQIRQICGLDWRAPQDMEQLSLAWHIELARSIAKS